MIYQIKDNRVYVRHSSEKDWEKVFDIEYVIDVFLAALDGYTPGHPKAEGDQEHE